MSFKCVSYCDVSTSRTATCTCTWMLIRRYV